MAKWIHGHGWFRTSDLSRVKSARKTLIGRQKTPFAGISWVGFSASESPMCGDMRGYVVESGSFGENCLRSAGAVRKSKDLSLGDVADQRLSAWFEPFWRIAPTGHLVERRGDEPRPLPILRKVSAVRGF
ncbi:MAG: hypothetical protein JSU06_10010 [Actinobacteria bacterium]|nr:hypothetical protein [Actinomycetota bacterium]